MAKTKVRKIVVGMLIALGILVLLAIIGIGILTITEYKPKDIESLEVNGAAKQALTVGDRVKVMSWNIGYGALGETADFFMDGGTHVSTATADMVRENMSAITDTIAQENPDVVFLQEVDLNSTRSHHMDEQAMIQASLDTYESVFAYNYKCLYVPYPWPPIGKVNCGQLTESRYKIAEATRMQLPCPFTYPMRIANLKRALLISRVDIEGSDKQLVLVNLHLEAYDDGEGKAKQTAILREFLQEERDRGNYVIAGGDFNQTFSNIDSSLYPNIDENLWVPGLIQVEDFGENFDIFTDSTTPSCRSLDRPLKGNEEADFQYYLIDGFIVSDNISVENVEILNKGFKNSDHNPVTITMVLD